MLYIRSRLGILTMKSPSKNNLSEHMFEKHKDYRKFANFLKQEAAVTLKPGTIVNNLQQLESMQNKHGLKLDNPDAEAVLQRMEDKGLATATMNLRRHALKMWMLFKGLKPPNKRTLKAKRTERVRKIYPKDLLTTADIEDITTHTNSPALRAFYWTLYDTAARPGAVCALNISDVVQDRHGYTFTFRNAKTEQSKRSVRLLIPKAIGYLEQWLAVHPRRADRDSPLFINRQSNRYDPSDLTSTLKMRHQKRVGKNLNMYLFRKSRATQLLKEKRFSEIEIKMRLGHKKHSRILEEYYAILDEEDQSAAELQYIGVDPVSEEAVQMPICNYCGALNAPDSLNCQRCLRPLTEEEMRRQVTLVSSETLRIFREDPEVLKASFVTLLADSEILKILASAVAEALVQDVERKAR